MTKEQMEQLVQRQLDAYNRRALEDFCSCYHREITVTNLISDQLVCTGIDQFKKVYRELFESSPKLNAKVNKRIVTDTAVLDEEFVSGASRYPNGLHTTAIYGFRDGLIDRVWFVK